jgi:ADP-dependent NAD(P)H-hydrate dehydratase / NAD(P)H-hydrate epimerase
MKIVTASEMREIDRATSERFGIPSLTLMENAGTAVANFVIEKYPSAQRIGLICGKGNNGGDGFVAARKLASAGKSIKVLLLAEPSELRGDAAEMLRRFSVVPRIARWTEDLKTEQSEEVFKSDVLIDAILGTGFRPPVSELYAAAIEAINSSAATVVAVDIPSGADADAMGKQSGVIARADAIVTFTAPRPAHIFGSLTAGPTLISSIGSPDEAVVSSLNLNVITTREVGPLIGPRPADSNKGNFGHVLVIGGSLGKPGAAAMAAMSALRAGAGLSTVATPRSVLSTVACFHPELMTGPLEETEEGSIAKSALLRIEELARGKTVLAIGPGVSRNAETAECIRNLVTPAKTPIVLDADGLNAFEGHADELNGHDRQIVITPHPGEMARLAGCSIADVQRDRIKTARTFAADHNLIVVLKGNRTLIAKPSGEVWVNTTGNPGMATGGTGDILTGMVAGMIAQYPAKVFDAVMAAVHLHGLAGDFTKESMGEQCMVATDLIKALPEAFRRTRVAAEETFVKIGG